MKLLMLALILTSYIYPSPCMVKRAVFDIGSGSTKVNVFQFDFCQKKIETSFECEHTRKVSYRSDFEKDGKLSNKIINIGKKAIKDLKREALKCGATEFAAVATSAFRVAPNGDEAIKILQKELGHTIHKISHEEEAILGYQSVRYNSTLPADKVCSWDIGGSSMQIVCSHRGETVIYPGKIASVSFMNQIIRFQESKSDSPNPINKKIADKSFNYAKKYALNHTPLIIRDLLRKGVRVFGIGGVHSYSISKNYDLETYRPDQLIKIYQARLNKTDKELIEGQYILKDQIPYVESTLSNLILVAAYMEALNIKKVEVTKASIAQGVLLSEQYWEKK